MAGSPHRPCRVAVACPAPASTGTQSPPGVSAGAILHCPRRLHHRHPGLHVIAHRDQERGEILDLLALARALAAAFPGLELAGVLLVEALLGELPGPGRGGPAVGGGEEGAAVLADAIHEADRVLLV